MPEIDVEVNGRSYRIACKDGEEEHLLQLAEHLDVHARALAKAVNPRSDAQLLLLAGLMVGDELSEALDRVEELELASRERRPDPGTGAAAQAVLDSAARRIEDLAGRIRSA